MDLLLAHGARVDAWDRSSDALAELAGRDGVATRVIDVTDPDAVRAAAEHTRTTWGATDFVVNSAGAFLVGPLAEVSAAAVRGLFDVNVVGTTLVTQALLPALREARGSIVNVASAVALTATPGNAHYAASKAAVAHLTRCWALELGPDGIRVNAVAPGPTATAIYRSAGMSAEQEADCCGNGPPPSRCGASARRAKPPAGSPASPSKTTGPPGWCCPSTAECRCDTRAARQECRDHPASGTPNCRSAMVM